MRRLKADFHTHCADDPCDGLAHSAESLIDAAAAAGLDVLAITCHQRMVHSHRLAAFAEARGVLLVPGIERNINRKHVVILNPDPEHLRANTFDDLRRIGRRNAAFIAPHIFYPFPNSLGLNFFRHVDLFDAIEYSSMYVRGLNPNWLAQWAARGTGLPMVGNSDAHELPFPDYTLTWIEAEPDVAGVIDAVRSGRVSIETRPRPTLNFTRNAYFAVLGMFEHLGKTGIVEEVHRG